MHALHFARTVRAEVGLSQCANSRGMTVYFGFYAALVCVYRSECERSVGLSPGSALVVAVALNPGAPSAATREMPWLDPT